MGAHIQHNPDIQHKLIETRTRALGSRGNLKKIIIGAYTVVQIHRLYTCGQMHMLIHRDSNVCTCTHTDAHALAPYNTYKVKTGYSTLHMAGNRPNHKA